MRTTTSADENHRIIKLNISSHSFELHLRCVQLRVGETSVNDGRVMWFLIVHPQSRWRKKLIKQNELTEAILYSTGGRELLNYYCEQIPGDAMLYSMFKIDSEPVKCPQPLKGKHDCRAFNLFTGAILCPLRRGRQMEKNNKKSINFQ